MCKSMKERIARFLFMGLAEGLDYLHETAQVVHRSIKLPSLVFATKYDSTDRSRPDRGQIANLKHVFELPVD